MCTYSFPFIKLGPYSICFVLVLCFLNTLVFVHTHVRIYIHTYIVWGGMLPLFFGGLENINFKCYQWLIFWKTYIIYSQNISIKSERGKNKQTIDYPIFKMWKLGLFTICIFFSHSCILFLNLQSLFRINFIVFSVFSFHRFCLFILWLSHSYVLYFDSSVIQMQHCRIFFSKDNMEAF